MGLGEYRPSKVFLFYLCYQLYLFKKRAMGIEPTLPAWKAGALPLSYARFYGYEFSLGIGFVKYKDFSSPTAKSLFNHKKVVKMPFLIGYCGKTRFKIWI
jgi:hypothetical protein